MNIFVLDRDPQVAALYHCNKHVVKMILESIQMLCAAHWLHHLNNEGRSIKDFKRIKDAQYWLFENIPKDLQPPWKLTHVRHPCTMWVCENVSNYGWLEANYPPGIPEGFLSSHPVCMKDDYKIYDDDGRISVVKSYKNYYILDKSRFAKWEPRARTPKWFSSGTQNK